MNKEIITRIVLLVQLRVLPTKYWATRLVALTTASILSDYCKVCLKKCISETGDLCRRINITVKDQTKSWGGARRGTFQFQWSQMGMYDSSGY